MNKLLTVREVAEILGCHEQTIYKWKDQGKIPHIRKSGLLRFRKAEIEDWIEQGSDHVDPLTESLTKVGLALDAYDKMFLKGVTMSHEGKTWTYPFGSVYLRQNKTGKERWYIYYRVEGKRIRKVVKGAQSRSDALKVLQVEVADAFRGKHGFKHDKKGIMFKELAELYLENFKSKKSWQADKYRTNAHLKPFFGKKELDEISPLMIQKYRTKRLNAGAQQSTTNRELALLKTMFFKAIDWGYTHSNPVRKVKFFSEKDKLKERILTVEEEGRLLEASPEELKPIILTALHTGMRRKEILDLKWKDVDLEKQYIKVVETKSGRNRTIPINGALLKELRKLKQEGQEYVFPFRHQRSVRTAFEKSRERASLFDLRFHDMRHTFATRLVERGVDLITVQELLGHHSVVVTQRYTHSNAEQKRRAVDVLSQNYPQIVHKNVEPQDAPLTSSLLSVS